MDRGIKDEAFISRALNSEGGSEGRWIANQASFNFGENYKLSPSVKSALVTAVNLYYQRGFLLESHVEEALKVETCGDARKFIDKYNELTLKR
jgi:hypothetical protein